MRDVITASAAVAVIATLVGISALLQPIRTKLVGTKFETLSQCPICLAFWISAPLSFWFFGFDIFSYFLVVATSNIWMLAIVKLYVELDLIGGD